MPSREKPTLIEQPQLTLIEYACERCGFVYSKAFDFLPFLCYRCLRFIGKRTWTTVQTIIPLSRTEHEDI